VPRIRLLPNATVSNDIPSSGMTGGGAIPAHELLSDGDTSTYMRTVNGAAGTLTRLDLNTYTLAVGERVIGAQIGVIMSQSQPLVTYVTINNLNTMANSIWAPVDLVDLNDPTPPIRYSDIFYFDASDGLEWTQADVNAMQLYVNWTNPGGVFEARVHEVWVDLIVKPKPKAVGISPAINEVIRSRVPSFFWDIPKVDGEPYTQLQYEWKMWTKAVVEGGGFDPNTSSFVAHLPNWYTSIQESGPFGVPHPGATELAWASSYYWSVRAGVFFPATPGTPWYTDWAQPVPFKTNSGPVADVVLPTGTITTNLPTVTWTISDDLGDPQIGYEVRIYKQPSSGSWSGFDPDTTTQAPLWTSGKFFKPNTFSVDTDYPLPDNSNFRAYVRSAQTTRISTGGLVHLQEALEGILWGAWASNDFATNFVEPNAPSLTVALFEDRVQLTVTPGTEPVTDIDYYVIQRSLDGGTTWDTFRYGTLTETDQLDDLTVPFVINDYEVPYFTEVQYRAYSVSTDLGVPLASFFSNQVVGYVESRNIWIKDTGDFGNNAHFPYADEYLQRNTALARTVYRPLGRTKPIVVKQQTNYQTFTVNLTVIGIALKEKLQSMIEGNRTLFVCTPKGCWYAEISGDVQWQDRLGDIRQGEEDVWKVSISFIEVEG